MRRFVIGTAGHVDHGKTSLVRALTGVDTDRLPEEKKRGITIELGFARWDLGGEVEASVIDVPGHRRLVHAMIAGAMGIEGVMLVVAADEGVMPQTREHVAICELLGIRRAVVVVTKCDLVDADLASLASDEATELASRSMRVEVVRCSVKTGDGLGDVRAAVLRMLSEEREVRATDRARLSVDRVFTVRGSGTVVTGTLVEGRFRVGDALRLIGRRGTSATSARGLQVHDAAVALAEAPTRLAVNLGGVALDDVARGDVLTTDAHLEATTRIDVALRGPHALKRGASAIVYVGTARAPARVAVVTEGAGSASARLRLAEPMVIAGGDRFVLRGSNIDGASGAVLGGGVVLDARAPSRRARHPRRALLEALMVADAPATMRALAVEAEPRPIARATLRARFSIAARALDQAAQSLVKEKELVRLGDHGWMRKAAIDELAARARALVEAHLREAPLDRGMPLQTLRERLTAIAGAEAAVEAMRVAGGAGGQRITMAADVATLPAAGGKPLDAALVARLDEAARAIRDASLHGASEFAVREATGATAAETRAILAKLVRDQIAVHVGDLWFSRDVVEDARTRAVAHLEGRKRLTVIDFKELTGLSRKQAILLLEHFDRLGLTRRDGDARVLFG
jgi:selenocysteine-specific elongation factor